MLVLRDAGRAGTGASATVTVDGVGWHQDAPSLESRSWDRAVYAELSLPAQ